MNAQQIRTELDSDAATYGPLSDGRCADFLNDKASAKAAPINRRAIPMYEVLGAVDWSEFIGAGLDAAKRQAFQILTSTETLDAGSATVRAAFTAIFPAGNTRTALAALASRQGSRAEVLWGDGARVSHDQVAEARRLP